MTATRLPVAASAGAVILLCLVTACGNNPDPGAAAEAGTAEAGAAETGVLAYCEGARDYLTERFGNPALVEPDSIQDWRTRQTFPGCRVYAASATALDMNTTARNFYDEILASGWIRTPDARDMPNEAAIRLRKDGMDCLYHVYNGPLLRTLPEIRVSGAVTLTQGERLYNIFVQCMPAMPAAPA